MKILFTIGFVALFGGGFAQAPNFIDGSEAAGMAGTSSNYAAAIVDIDQDGLEDIYIGSKNQPNKLYRNNGDGTFTDIAPELGLDFAGNTYTSIWCDFDNDGDTDGYLGNFDAPNTFYRNLGNGLFAEEATQLGIAGVGKTRCVTSADVNNDGFLDIYVINLTQHNEFYLSDGNGGYTDFYFASGATDALIGMGAVFFDSDNDGDQDLYLTHDAYQANKFYINDGTGHFINNAVALGADHAGEGMGVDVTDLDHDGWMDIYIANNYDGNTLLMNNGDGSFTDYSGGALIEDIGMGWGTAFTDFNLDGEKDIYVVNNYAFTSVINPLFENNGDTSFTQVGQGTILDSPNTGAGFAVADLDLNGTEDFVIANALTGSSVGVQLLWNETLGNNWINLKLQGTASNRDAIGSRAVIYTQNTVQTDVVLSASGYSQMNSLKLNFGLGTETHVDSAVVSWPSGLVETFENLNINQTHALVEGSQTFIPLSGDFDENMQFDVIDLLILLGDLGCEGDACIGDLNNDGMVNSTDLLFLLTLFGGE
ncbi:MAG: hypothetical protein ACJAU0_001462 [Flavobacteriales bacterium]|jgi:hypothetical protein